MIIKAHTILKIITPFVYCTLNISTANSQSKSDSASNSILKISETTASKFDNSKNQILNGVSTPNLDSNSLKFWKKPFKIPVPTKKNKLSGQIGLTAFYTDIQNPRSLNEKQFVRFYGTPEIMILGLPFIGNFNFTTENNTLYNSNTFSINFDKQQYLDNLKQQATDQVTGYKKELSEMNRDIQKQHFEMSSLKKKIDYEKRKLSGDSISGDKLINQWDQELSNTIANESEKKIKARKEGIDTAEYKQRIDSFHYEYNSKVADLREKQAHYDSLYKIMLYRYEQMSNKYEEMEVQFEEAKKYVQKADSLSKNPEFILSSLVQQGKQSNFLSAIHKIEKFNVGNINPNYGDLTLNGLPVRGIDLKFKHTFIYKFTLGKTFSNLLPSQLQQNNKLYNRKIIFGAIGLKNKNGSIFLNTGRIWDDENSLNKRVFNNLLGLQIDYLFLKRIFIKSELLLSDYNNIYNSETNLTSDYNNGPPIISLADKLAFSTSLNYSMGNSTKFYSNLRRFGSQFINIGNPFLRNDFQEYRVGIETNTLKNKIAISGFYYSNSDNLQKSKTSTYNTKGFGFQAQTNFTGKPNIGISYTPFIQGTHHPDSLLRSNNHFATKTATVSYQKATKAMRFFLLTSFTDGVIQFGDEGVKMHNRSLQSLFSVVAKKWQANYSYTKSFTEGKIDTMSFNMFTLNANYTASRNFTFGIQQQYAYFLNGGKRIFNSINIRYKFSNKLSVQIHAGYNSINKIWGIEQMIGFTGRCVIVIKL